MELRLATLPPSASIGASASVSSSGPIALTRKLSSSTAGSSFPKRSPECSTPAQLTSRSKGVASPASGSSRASAAMAAGRATSSGSTRRRPGWSAASALSAVARPGSRAVATTLAPPSSNWRANSSPSPRFAPVTRQFRNPSMARVCRTFGLRRGKGARVGWERCRPSVMGGLHLAQECRMSFATTRSARPARLLRTGALALALATSLGAAFYLPAAHADSPAPVVSIPYQQFTLPNGLTVIVHEDHKAPIVAVNIWYGVGSKNEPAGRSGFAHLFEHLMFNGSENYPGEYFEPFEQAGATDMNGTTNTDRTNYFQNVPTTALDMALWTESDRMGHLLGAIDQKVLDEQRGVVQNEKRQGENQPYGQLRQVVAQTMYPEGHPYHHTTIGSMNDLNAASLEDVKQWFRTWYGPNNAVLVLAGDIDVETAKQKVAKYFGDIPASTTMPVPGALIAPWREAGRTVLEDKVPQLMVRRMWNVPQVGTRDSDLLDLFSAVLGGSASSRLDKRLVHQD